MTATQTHRQLVEKNYIFAGPDGPETLAGLFVGLDQLIVYHFKFGPQWEEGFDPTRMHPAHRDVALAVVSCAPMPRIAEFQKRMGWHFHWVSALESSFEQDFGLNGAPGFSVFHKDEAGRIFHTYSSYWRALDLLMGTDPFFDPVPNGRDEDDLAFSMAWVRHHDKYTPISETARAAHPPT